MPKHLLAISFVLLLLSCNEESTGPANSTVPDYSNDYFPFTPTYLWSYSTNAFSDSGKSTATFDMRIDRASFSRGVFYALLGRLSGTTQWGPILGVKDSAGIVYLIGDNPPETPFPIFQHHYSASEAVRDSIAVLGTMTETVRIDINTGNGIISFWLAKGIGLVKESSDKGISLFTDDNSGQSVLIQTTLQSVSK